MIAVYPGSFDPITLGHVDIIERISPCFHEVHVLVAQASEKNYMFKPEERVEFFKQALPNINNLKFHMSSGLTVDFDKKIGAQCIVRGLRVVSDFEYEMVMANMNKKLAPDIETFIVFANPQYNFVSSRLVKEVAAHQGDLSGLVPECVRIAFNEKYSKQKR